MPDQSRPAAKPWEPREPMETRVCGECERPQRVANDGSLVAHVPCTALLAPDEQDAP